MLQGLGLSGLRAHIADRDKYLIFDNRRVMTEGYRLITVFKALLRKPNDQVGRPMSIRTAVIIWLVLLIISLYGAYDFYFGV